MDVLKVRPSTGFLEVLRELHNVPGAPKNIVAFFSPSQSIGKRPQIGVSENSDDSDCEEAQSDQLNTTSLRHRKKWDSSNIGEGSEDQQHKHKKSCGEIEEDKCTNDDKINNVKPMKVSEETENNQQNKVKDENREEEDILQHKNLLGKDETEDGQTAKGDKGEEEDILTLSVSEVKWCHQRMRERGMPMRIHQLLNDSQLLLPSYAPPPRSKALEQRCEKLRTQQQNKEYADMTRNLRLGPTPGGGVGGEFGQMQRELNQQLVTGVQYLISVVGVFFALFVSLGFADQELAFRLLVSIAGALTVGLAELYFIIKQDMCVEEQVIKKKKKK